MMHAALASLRGTQIGTNSPVLLEPKCPFIPGNFMSYLVPLLESMVGLSGVTDMIACYRRAGDDASAYILVLYLVVSMVLLLNMLIAMMVPDR
jgi:hypothetical protein